MLRDLRDDWRALLAQAEAENTEFNRIDGYARIVTGVQALAAGLDLQPEMQGYRALWIQAAGIIAAIAALAGIAIGLASLWSGQ